MDAVDITQARLEAEDELKRKRQEQEAAKPKAVFRECQECGDEMPAVRQAYGFRFCVECQSLLETRQLRYGGRDAHCD